MATVLLFVRLFLVLGVLRLAGLPLARLALPGLPATAYAVASGVALLVASHTTWLLAHAGMRIGVASMAIGGALLAVGSGLALRRLRRQGVSLLARPGLALGHHLAFALAFALALFVVAHNPSVDPDSERFMDHAMVNAVLASRTLPLESPWLAGERVSYYDYGYFSTAWLSLLAGPRERFFPVAVALVYAAFAAGVFAIARDLGRLPAGLLAVLLVAVGGNLDALVQTANVGASSLDWFHSARAVKGAITEFPFFTLLWGDLHPYALAAPLWPTALAIAWSLSHGPLGAAGCGLGALAYAALIATHTWDAVPVLAVMVLAAVLAGSPSGRLRASRDALTVLLGGGLLAIPFLLHAPTAGRGLAWVATRSTVAELFVAWGSVAVLLAAAAVAALLRSGGRSQALPLALLAAALAVLGFPEPGVGLAIAGAALALALALAARSAGPRDEAPFAWSLAAVGLGLIAGVELLYVDDFYVGELERMNTVFKAYFAAWILLGVAASLLVARELARAAAARALARAPLFWLTLAVAAAVLVYPVRALPARAAPLLALQELDARTVLRERYPDDAAVIALLARRERGVVLETTGDPYTWSSRFATFTGFPAVVGWGHHEAGWRNDWTIVLERVAAVRSAYRGSREDLDRVITRYGIRYVVVGSLEHAEYDAAALAKFAAFEPTLERGETRVFEVRDGRLPERAR